MPSAIASVSPIDVHGLDSRSFPTEYGYLHRGVVDGGKIIRECLLIRPNNGERSAGSAAACDLGNGVGGPGSEYILCGKGLPGERGTLIGLVALAANGESGCLIGYREWTCGESDVPIGNGLSIRNRLTRDYAAKVMKHIQIQKGLCRETDPKSMVS